MSTSKKLNLSKDEILNDYYIAHLSRNISLLGRKEVLTGKAKFGIFGDGKELAQIALAKTFKNGDWRSGYYRDQTFMMAAGIFSAEEFFAQLYGQTDVNLNPGNAGRTFNNHFATRSLNPDGTWKDLTKQKNSTPDISPTAGQMPRLLGLAWASKLFKQNKELWELKQFTNQGNEVAFGTIGDASTSEGHFWETLNAAAVLQVPMVLAVWDDGYGISVPKDYQTAKGSISELVKGFEKGEKDVNGIHIYKVKGWDYPALIETFTKGVEKSRTEHVPVLFHVTEITQPQGHSTSGSHERYKSPERLQWEKDFDCNLRFRNWILENGYANTSELDQIEAKAQSDAKDARKKAWEAYSDPIKRERDELIKIIDNRSCMCKREHVDKVGLITEKLKAIPNPIRKDNISAAKQILRHVCSDCSIREKLQADLTAWIERNMQEGYDKYSSHLYCETERAAWKVKGVAPIFKEDSPMVAGREILRDNWDAQFKKNKKIVVFGEDVGGIGGVNQTYEGLQKKYGEIRITDTGIRETTILGQGLGAALRGLRPIAEIQYFDYLLYTLQTMSDDLATIRWRTKSGQMAPLIITTRGHRLEGVWHAGSPLSMVINSIRGVYVCVPRNMTQAAGFYNTLLEADDPALVIEPLNGYRLKEKRPENIGEYKIPLGVPEILREGSDVTLLTYGSNVRIAQEAVEQLWEFGISVELIDVQTLLPFDLPNIILDSIKKTNRVVFFDEDVPGGATAYMMQKVLEERNGYMFLDSPPKTITAKEHRPAYTSDGDYFSNPNAEDVFDGIYELMHEVNPKRYPKLF
ncbi:alpha-ketoacid dehydrogenase subunit alpha/beta [Tenuifilum thalassicum]|uniref:3-methyl-2-oxobutanoate dehydrogenase (2-methylpropanoyl-transferring) n=1 Tax=Tenuifilum thalassicum TaxID=2590900 RepID=A0A7D4BD38_9BACT|nr:alpha-ketoacid dehydrogenase subunit alpha/beta [Tenuifilum thalassicum]QKG79363.1 transketolase [Tenuifilum thalassicum]